jgi:hypothetical protein
VAFKSFRRRAGFARCGVRRSPMGNREKVIIAA